MLISFQSEMGCCCSNSTNSAISGYLDNERRKFHSTVTVTGTHHAKNKLWKRLELTINPCCVQENANDIAKSIRYQILDCMIGLVEQCNVFYGKDPIKYCDCLLVLNNALMMVLDEIASFTTI